MELCFTFCQVVWLVQCWLFVFKVVWLVRCLVICSCSLAWFLIDKLWGIFCCQVYANFTMNFEQAIQTITDMSKNDKKFQAVIKAFEVCDWRFYAIWSKSTNFIVLWNFSFPASFVFTLRVQISKLMNIRTSKSVHS